MFKRVEKRMRKLDKEESMGLTEEMKEVLGMHDTDSDESDSASGSDTDDMSSGESVEDKGDGDVDMSAVDEGNEQVEEGDVPESEGENEQEYGAEDEAPELQRPPLSVTEAITDPIYSIAAKSTVKACAVCPTKRFKDEKFVEEHRNSQAHYRRFARFVEFAGTADPETNMDDFWHELDEENKKKAPKSKTTDGPLSKRAEKRKAKLEAIKAKRKKSKEMKAKGMARKAALKVRKKEVVDDSDASDGDYIPVAPEAETKATKAEKQQQPKKKRKVEANVELGAEVVQVRAQVVTAPTAPAISNEEPMVNSEVKAARDVGPLLKPSKVGQPAKVAAPKPFLALETRSKKKRPRKSS